MNKSGTGGSIFIRILILLLVLSVILASSFYLFIKSPSFIQFLEYAIGTSTGSAVSIGAAHLKKGPVVIIKDLVIKRSGSDEPFILLPYTEIKAGFPSLISRRIDRLDLRGPKVFLRLKDDIISRGDRTGFSLPFILKNASIDNGEVVLLDKEGGSFRISAVHLSLHEKGKERSVLKGSLFLDEIGSTVPVEMMIDMRTITVEEGEVEITLKEVEKLPYKELAFLSDKELRGELMLRIGMHGKEAPGLRLFGRFEDMSIQGKGSSPLMKEASGELKLLLSVEKGHDAFKIESTGSFSGRIRGIESKETFSLMGAYRYQADEFRIEEAILESSLFGSHVIQGNVMSVRRGPEMELSVEARDIPMKVIHLFADEFSHTLTMDGHGEMDLLIRGSAGSPRAEGTLLIHGQRIKGKGFRLGPFSTRLPLHYEADTLTIKGASIQTEGAYIGEDDAHDGSLNNAVLSISSLTYRESKLTADAIHLTAGGAVIRKKEIIYQIEEGLSLSASIRTVPEGAITRVTGKADLQITGSALSSPDGTIASEGINMNLQGGFGFDLPFTRAEFNTDAGVSDFELLIGRFYGSFKDKNLRISLKGDYSVTEDSLKILGAELGLTDLGTVLFSAHIEELTGVPHFNADINLTKLNNKKAFDFFLRETFQESLPLLSDMDLGGTTSINLSIKGTTDTFDADGEFSTVNVDILKKDSGFSLKGLNIYLPFDISYPEASHSKDTGRFGSLRMGEISWGEVRIKDLQAYPAIQQNAVIFKEDIIIPVFKGQIRLQDLRWENILSPDKNLLLSLHIDRIDLDEVTRVFDIPRFSGNLSGSIPRVGMAGDSLVTEGEILLTLFGGQMTVGDLTINNIFSSVPSLQASINIEEIDLSEVTGTFEFGHISGRMSGYVNNLVIANGQAESFESSIETVHSKDVKQWISVQALEKITVLGGSSSSVLNRGIYRLFKQYRYEKIGFKGSLKNDNFLLLGLKAEDDSRYIVKGGLLPPKVDVINYNQNVSFKEMVERLKRINKVK